MGAAPGTLQQVREAGGDNDVTCDDTQARAPGQAPASAAPRASAWSVSRATAASGWRAPPRHIRASGGARPSQPPSPSQVRIVTDEFPLDIHT